MLGRDELCASIRQCLEILTRAQGYLEEISSPLTIFADISALFEGFLCDLDKMDRKQASPTDDDGMWRDTVKFYLNNNYINRRVKSQSRCARNNQ